MCLLLSSPAYAILTNGAERRLASDINQDIEPTAVSYLSGGTEYRVAVWMQFNTTVQSPNSVLRYHSWNSAGGTTSAAIPLHASYVRYADPVVVKDDSTTTLYLVGLGITSGGARALLTWSSTTHGASWSAASVVLTGTALDKPAATTATGGVLWIAYMQTSSSLRAVRGVFNTSTQVFAWDTPLTIDNSTSGTTTTGQNPQVMVDSNGDVYVQYMTANNELGLMWLQSGGSAFSRRTVINVGTLYPAETGTQWMVVKTTAPTVTVRGLTIPVAKLDRSRRRISIAWHESNGGSGSLIRFIAYRTDTGSWSSAVTVSNGGGFEINTGMDFNPADGNYVVTWYSFGPLTTTAQYAQKGAYVSFDGSGNPVAESGSLITSRWGNAANLTADVNGRCYLGDYHDVTFSNGSWKSMHIIAPQTNFDGTLTDTPDPWSFTVTH